VKLSITDVPEVRRPGLAYNWGNLIGTTKSFCFVKVALYPVCVEFMIILVLLAAKTNSIQKVKEFLPP